MQQPRSKMRVRRGFTLMEAAIVTVIVGVGILGMMELLAAGSMANGASTELSTAMGLSSNIHEMSLNVAYDDIMTLNGLSYSPPVDARKVALSDASMSGWRQQVTVNYVDPNRVTINVPNTQVEPVARVTVRISRNGQIVYTNDWLAAASEWP